MKNLIRAAGALSLGAASMALTHSAVAAEGGDKPWTASASLRGFYDDNIFTANSAAAGGVAKIDSFGFDISPSVTYGRTMDNTSFDLGYTYLARWFENRPGSNWDQNHNASVNLSHVFSPRAKVNVSDVFVSAQDPGQFAPGSGLVLRAEGDNISNAASVSAELAATDTIVATASYRNNLFDYDNAAFATSLNRVEHLPALELSDLLSETTSATLGYQFGIFDFDQARDFNLHTIYGGVKHTFTQSFYGMLNAGVQVTDYDFAGVASTTSPYLDGKLVYQYAAGSDVAFNVRHQVNATDVYLAAGGGLLAANQQTTLFRIAWGHAFTARIKGTAIAQFQNSTFNGGAADGATETFWTLGATVGYAVSHNVSVDLSYFHDSLNSDPVALGFDRGYGRNRLFLGVTAKF